MFRLMLVTFLGGMKRIPRFYKDVSVGFDSATKRYNLLLDGKTVKTPLGESFHVESDVIASAITTEWKHQEEFLVPNTMPMSTMLMTYIDIDSKIERNDKLQQINRFLLTDTVRFPDENQQSTLAKEQERVWQPVLNFFTSTYGIPISQSRTGFGIPPGSEEEIERINQIVLSPQQFSGIRLTVLETAAKYLKSGSIGIALMEGALTPDSAFDAAYVEEIVQRREWGECEGDHDLNDAETILWLRGIDVLNSCLVAS